MKTRDLLWKTLIEEHFEAFGFYFLPKLASQIDFTKKPVFLDKELQKIFPESAESRRHVDKLVKVWLLNGQEQWIIVHVEVQGYLDPQFGERMFIYYYRLFDRYRMPIVALAILTDDNPHFHPRSWEQSFHGTTIVYGFNTHKVLEHPLIADNTSDNPFSLIMESVYWGLQKKQLGGDKGLLAVQLDIIRRLFRKGYPREKVESLLTFIHLYTRFENSKTDSTFVKEIEHFKKVEKAMTTLQLANKLINEENRALRKKWKTEGRQEGLEQGIEQGLNLAIEKLLQNGISIEMVSNILGVSLDRVETVRAQMDAKS